MSSTCLLCYLFLIFMTAFAPPSCFLHTTLQLFVSQASEAAQFNSLFYTLAFCNGNWWKALSSVFDGFFCLPSEDCWEFGRLSLPVADLEEIALRYSSAAIASKSVLLMQLKSLLRFMTSYVQFLHGNCQSKPLIQCNFFFKFSAKHIKYFPS